MRDDVLHHGGRDVAHAQPVGRVLPHRHPGEDRIALEHHGILRPLAAGRHVDLDGAGGGGFEAGENAQQRRLPAAGRPDDHEELALPDVERDIVDGDESPERLDEMTNSDRWGQRRGRGARWGGGV